MTLSLLLTAFALGAGGCGQNDSGPREINEGDAIAICKEAIHAQLKDPDSAKYGESAAHLQDVYHWNVVGVVNAKNSMGGYVGDTKFTCVLSLDSQYRFTEVVEAKIGN